MIPAFAIYLLSAHGVTYPMGSHIVIDTGKCIGCGLCAGVCIRDNICIRDGRAEETSGPCFDCGHCVAVCPKEAISLRCSDSMDLSFQDSVTDEDSLYGLLTTRRSCRWFKDQPLTDRQLDILFRAASQSPSAQNAMDVEFAVINRNLDGFMELLADILEPLAPEYPRIAQFVDYVHSDRSGPNPFLWEGKQVILAFSAEVQNACVSMSRIELMAHSMGLGGFYSLWISMADRQDHDRFMSFFPDISPEKTLGCVYIIGVPRIRYRRQAPRRMPEVHRY